jgi:hypothetical protein
MCKVLLFSGQAQTGDLLRAAREQGHDFKLLTKPVRPVDLLHQIREQNLRGTYNGMDAAALS